MTSTFFTDLLQQTVTITSRVDGSTDGYGVPAKTTTATATAPAYLEPIEETQQLVEAETYRTTWKLFLLPDASISTEDLVTDANGVVYQVLMVLPFTNARTGQLHHIECRLEEVQG
jgi:hypothetical protein